jgi:hypothetical protein
MLGPPRARAAPRSRPPRPPHPPHEVRCSSESPPLDGCDQRFTRE